MFYDKVVIISGKIFLGELLSQRTVRQEVSLSGKMFLVSYYLRELLDKKCPYQGNVRDSIIISGKVGDKMSSLIIPWDLIFY